MQSMDQSISQSVNQIIIKSVNQSIDWSIDQSIDPYIFQPIYRSAEQSIASERRRISGLQSTNHTDLHKFPWRISWENLIKEPKYFTFDDHHIYWFSQPFLLLIYGYCQEKIHFGVILVFRNYQNSYLATRLGEMQKKWPINTSLELNAISFVLNTN